MSNLRVTTINYMFNDNIPFITLILTFIQWFGEGGNKKKQSSDLRKGWCNIVKTIS